jgi:hypothetical protein
MPIGRSWLPKPELTTRQGQPLPAGSVLPGRPLSIVVGTVLGEATAWVDVVMRSSTALQQRIRAQSIDGVAQSGARWFAATLPAPGTGQSCEYRVELLRLRRCIATLPADGSWLQIIGNGATATEPLPVPPAEAKPEAEAPAGQFPRWRYETTFFGASTVDLRPEPIGPTPDGYRINFYAKNGTLVGPDVDAIMLEGADNVSVRPDGVAALTVTATWQTQDGALLFERAVGMCDLGPDGYTAIGSGSWSGTPPITLAQTWLSAHPRWTWLNRRQTWALGRTLADELQVQTDIYLLTVGERFGHA